ncbi:lysosomal acid glucosylceramidase-like [Asterias amurensis]|uniref:lysosomal acid glucosylceramidase-like n=1 Tax=Asterias amurensis TaxID=7602 RepID=UPI003AB65F92
MACNLPRIVLMAWMVHLLLLVLQGCDQVEAVYNQDEVECKRKTIQYATSFVCECSATYCDTVQSVDNIEAGTFAMITSSLADHRFSKSQHVMAKKSNLTDMSQLLKINSSVEYQTILGFGGAFTDSATINIMNLSSKAQDNLLKSYYSTNGIEYTIGRIPMASCDFSLKEYSYDDVPNDFDLKQFSLVTEDIKFKIPIIQRSLAMSKKEVKLFASPWSAPAWMKTSNKMSGRGQLLGQAGDKYHQTWANYFVKFLDAYKLNNLTMWGLTIENEPSAGATDNAWQAMYLSAEMERDFIKKDLGPALHQAGYADVKLMVLDDQRLFLPSYVQTILSDAEAAKYISGTGVHWYADFFFDSPSVMTDTHNLFPDKFILSTEACNGYLPDSPAVVLGSWERGEEYSHDIMQDLSNWVTGWTDWNLALNLQGGPNWAKNEVDSPIIIDAEKDVFYKQPMFYHLGHFSKFIPPGSKRIQMTATGKDSLEKLAFKLPDGKTIAVVVLNRLDETKPLSIYNPASGYINALVAGRSINTYLFS